MGEPATGRGAQAEGAQPPKARGGAGAERSEGGAPRGRDAGPLWAPRSGRD